jgi:polysaccharide biosynthesis protein PslH
MTRRSLLFLSQTLPYPPHSGVKIRTYHILRILAKEFETTALCFFRSKSGGADQVVKDSLAALGEFASIEAFPIPQEHSRGRLAWDHLRSIAMRRTYTVFSYESRPYRARLEKIMSQHSFDLVHADSLDLSAYFPTVAGLPLVCVHHDAQSTLLRRRADHQQNPLMRLYLRTQAKLMAEEERRWCPRVNLNVAVSSVDQQAMQALAPGSRFAVVPNGVDVDFFRPQNNLTPQHGLVFVGGVNWFPNRDALHYFRDEILPVLRARGLSEPVTWVGRASAEEIEEFGAGEGAINITGYVPDIRPYVHSAACYIVPIRAGSGTRIKILDAWAMGKAVVSTSIGCEGLAAVDGQNILIRDTPAEFVDAVELVLKNPDLRQTLGEQARRTAEEHYSWKAIGERMVEQYRALL